MTIYCQGTFDAEVHGVFEPDQAPPRLCVYAGIAKYPEPSWGHRFHCANIDMSPDPGTVNSDGSGFDGGSVELCTTQRGLLHVSVSADAG